jgi:UDP-4-amino-4-deoxy-L-arabinose-oxoglutarate aminotransferase
MTIITATAQTDQADTTDRVDFYRHQLGEAELEEMAHTLEGVFLTAGPRTRQFEEWLANYLGVAGAVGLFTCTTALYLSQKALGIGPGDEVITTPMTFIATSNSILHTGAKVVFVDCDPVTGNIDLDQVEAAVTPRTRAVIPVHLYGHMVDMRRLREIADRRGITVIEDCAHCIEGERDGVRPGQLGDIACFSFYATKNMAAGEGGAVASRDAELLDHVRRLRTHGMSKEAAGRYTSTYQHWDMLELGYKGNMFDIQAALLLPQIPHVDERWQRREHICRRYEEAFSRIGGVDFPRVIGGTKSARHLFTIWVDPARRDDALAALQQRGIGVAVNYRAVHVLTYYREALGYRRGMYPNAERIGDSTITLPLYPSLTDEQVETVIDAVRGVAATVL